MPSPSKSRVVTYVAVGVWAMVLTVVLIRAWLQPRRNTVYPIFATAAREWRQGVDLYDTTIPREFTDWYRYAPIVAVAFTPFAALPNELGGMLWRFVNVAVFFAGAAAFVRVIAPGDTKSNPKTAAWLALLIVPLVVGSLNNGQANLVVLGCLLGATAGLARQCWQLSAVCLAVAVLFKLYPLSAAALLLLVEPRPGWRLALALVVGCLAPFAFQEPGFVVHSYESWLQQLVTDHRHDIPVENSYRDFHVFLRALGLHLPETLYCTLQLAMAGLVAAVVLRGHWQGWSRSHHLRAAFDLGCCWMMLFGPATENCTYALLAPTAVLAAWDSLQDGQPSYKRVLAWTAAVVLVSTALSGATPWGKFISCFGMPLGGVLVFTERLLNYCLTPRRPATMVVPIESLAQAA